MGFDHRLSLLDVGLKDTVRLEDVQQAFLPLVNYLDGCPSYELSFNEKLHSVSFESSGYVEYAFDVLVREVADNLSGLVVEADYFTLLDDSTGDPGNHERLFPIGTPEMAKAMQVHEAREEAIAALQKHAGLDRDVAMGIVDDAEKYADKEMTVATALNSCNADRAALGAETEVEIESQTDLTWAQKAITKLYCGGDMSHVETLEAAQNCGDGLLTFLINESCDAENLLEYIGMVGNARDQLDRLLDDLELYGPNKEKSYEEAAQIVSGKAGCELVDADIDKTYDGKVMGVTDMHVALSLGRKAVIIQKSDLDIVPAKNEEVVVKFASGLGYVELTKAKLVER